MTDTSVSLCSFYINGTKDKDIYLDNLLSKFDIVLFQEHLLPGISMNFLRRSSEHIVFTTNTRRTRGRPSVGLPELSSGGSLFCPISVMPLMRIIELSESVT